MKKNSILYNIIILLFINILVFNIDQFVFGDSSKKVSETKAITIYLSHLKKGSVERKRNAAIQLGNYKDPRAVKGLIQALNEDDYFVQYNAKKSLIKLDQHSIPFIIDSLKSKKRRMRLIAADILKQIGSKKSVPALNSCAVNDNSYLVRASCVKALGIIKDKRSVPTLIETLNDKKWKVRAESARSLGFIQDLRAVDPLIDKLNDKNSHVRLNATVALGRIKDKTAVPHLIQKLKDSDSETREMAAWSLGNIEDKRAAKALIRSITKDRNGNVRSEAKEALKKLGYTADQIERYKKN